MIGGGDDSWSLGGNDAPACDYHGWKNNSVLAKPLAACTYLSSIVSELYDA